MKIYDGRELQNLAQNHSVDIGCKVFVKIYRNCTNEPYSFFTIDTTLQVDSPLRFRKTFSYSPL